MSKRKQEGIKFEAVYDGYMTEQDVNYIAELIARYVLEDMDKGQQQRAESASTDDPVERKHERR